MTDTALRFSSVYSLASCIASALNANKTANGAKIADTLVGVDILQEEQEHPMMVGSPQAHIPVGGGSEWIWKGSKMVVGDGQILLNHKYIGNDQWTNYYINSESGIDKLLEHHHMTGTMALRPPILVHSYILKQKYVADPWIADTKSQIRRVTFRRAL